MPYTAQQYLDLYSKLTDKQLSKKANLELIKLQQSAQSWDIACELMQNSSHHIHGCQLLSKKLSKPLPNHIPISTLFSFVWKFSQKSDLLYCIIGKILMHHGDFRLPQYLQGVSQLHYLCIFKQFVSSTAGVETSHHTDLRQLSSKFFEAIKPTLNKYFQQYPELVLACIDMQVSNHGHLNSAQLLQKVLKCSIEDTKSLLETIFLEEDLQQYNYLNQSLWQYFNKLISNSQSRQTIMPAYLAFCRRIILPNIWQWTVFLQIFKNILDFIKENIFKGQQKNHYPITDTLEFWAQLSNKFNSKFSQCDQQLKKIIFQAFLQLWRIILLSSKKNTIPERKSQPPVIDLDALDDIEDLQINDFSMDGKFRIAIQDFLTLCVDVLMLNQQYMLKFYTMLHEYANSDKLEELQVCVFVMSNLAELGRQGNIKYQEQIIKTLLQKQSLYNNYLSQKVLVLLGHEDRIVNGNINILCQVLDFMKKALQVQDLSAAAARNLCQILLGFKDNSIQTFKNSQEKDTIAKFLDYVYNNIYENCSDLQVLEVLTHCLLCFIFKFQNNASAFQAFFKTFLIKISNQKNHKDKVKYLQCLLSSTLWSSSHSLINNQDFYVLLNELVLNYRPLLLQHLQQVNRKHELSQAIKIINLAIRQLGYYKIEFWLQFIQKLILKLLETIQIYGILLSPLIYLLKNEQQQKLQQESKIKLTRFLEIYEPRITQLFNETEKVDYNLSKFTIQLHTYINQYYRNPSEQSYKTKYNSAFIAAILRKKMNQSEQYSEFQICRAALMLFIQLVKRKQQRKLIVETVLYCYRRMIGSLSKFVDTVLIESFKRGQGRQILIQAFRQVKPQLLPPNPLWQSFQKALTEGDTKTIHSILICLT